MSPLQVEVVTPLPEGWGLCQSCEAIIAFADLAKAPAERGIEEYPPEWQADLCRLSGIILDLASRYGERILFRLWDPRSLQGLYTSLRYGVRRYPTFIIAGKSRVTGWDIEQLENLITAALTAEEIRSR